jgi:hypothetical protein
MGHSINAIIGTRQALDNLASRFGPPDVVELAFNLVIVPLDEQRLDAIAMSDEASFDGFCYLKPTMAREIESAVCNGCALYIETNYFGGTGSQSAAFFDSGQLVWKQVETTLEAVASKSWLARLFNRSVPTKSPISQGLARLGVVASKEQDEFDQLGLIRFRSLEAFGFELDS